MKKPICYMLIGCPGAGKSTWIKSHMSGDFIVISSDNIIEKYAEERGKTYTEVFNAAVKKASKQVMLDAHAAANTDKTVVIDRTNMTRASRQKFIDIFKDSHNISAVVFDVPEDIVKRLNSRPGKEIPMHVVNNMINSFEQPLIEEGFEIIWKAK